MNSIYKYFYLFRKFGWNEIGNPCGFVLGDCLYWAGWVIGDLYMLYGRFILEPFSSSHDCLRCAAYLRLWTTIRRLFIRNKRLPTYLIMVVVTPGVSKPNSLRHPGPKILGKQPSLSITHCQFISLTASKHIFSCRCSCSDTSARECRMTYISSPN